MPDTYAYFVAAYAIAGVLYVGYLASLFVRGRSKEEGGRR